MFQVATTPPGLALLVVVVWCAHHASAVEQGTVLGNLLQSLAVNDLGVEDMQEYLDSQVEYVESPLDGSKLVNIMAGSLGAKFTEKIEVVQSLKDKIEDQYARFASTSSFPECCHATGLEDDARFKNKVNLNEFCTSGEQISSATKFVNQQVRDLMKENLRRYPTIKWQYFGSEEGVMTVYPSFPQCDVDYDPRFRSFYVSTATPEPKDVVLVIDTSGSMTTSMGSSNRLNVAIEAAITVINTLNPNDRLGVVSFGSEPEIPSGSIDTSTCYSSQLAKATPLNKKYLEKYVTNLRASGGTYYGKAFETAFKLMRNTGVDEFDTRERDKVVLFLTDGDPSDLQESILATLRTENGALGNKVVILTYGIGEALDDKPRAILESIAKQYDYDPTKGEIQEGEFTPVAQGNDLRRIMGSYYNFFSKTGQIPEATFVVPYYDAFGLGLVTSACLPVYYSTRLVGVTCVDMTMSDLLSDVTYFKEGELSYAFLIDGQARLLMHPLLPQPYAVEEDPIYVNMLSLETFSGADSVMSSMLRGEVDEKIVSSQRVISRGNAVYEGVKTTDVMSTYSWRPVSGTQLSVCLVIADDDKQATIEWNGPYDSTFTYHRLDLKLEENKNEDFCNYYGRLALKDRSTVGFSPEAFKNPYTYLSTEETITTVDSYEVYMTGASNNNPQFKDGIRETVAVTAHFDEVLGRLGRSEYVVWRYIGMHDGVFRVIPGSSQDKAYDHTLRHWYRRSLSQKGRLTISTPYIDGLGAGFVVTLSKTLYEGRSSGTHSSSDMVVGVTAMDFSLAYVYTMLTNNFTQCQQQDNTCFIIEKSGFIVVHKEFVEVQGATMPEIENIHITVKEPYIASDLISKNVMIKSSCINFETLRDQEFWTVSIRNGRQVITSDYELYEVDNTNIFLVIKKYTGNKLSYCNCPSGSLTSYSGLGTCQGVECECPCSKKTDIYQYCQDTFDLTSDSAPPCAPRIPPVDLDSASSEERHAASKLDTCFNYGCSSKKDKNNCISTASCSWCTVDEDGELDIPYCGTQNECPFGIVGAGNGGGEGGGGGGGGGGGDGGDDDDSSSSGSNIGVIAGAAVGAIVILVIAAVVGFCIYKRRNKMPDTAPPPSASRGPLPATAAAAMPGNQHQGYDNPAMQPSTPSAPPTPAPTYPTGPPPIYESIDPPPAYGNAGYTHPTAFNFDSNPAPGGAAPYSGLYLAPR